MLGNSGSYKAKRLIYYACVSKPSYNMTEKHLESKTTAFHIKPSVKVFSKLVDVVMPDWFAMVVSAHLLHHQIHSIHNSVH